MELALCIRQFLKDKFTLDDYVHEKSVSWDDIKRRLFTLEKTYNPAIPDHSYKYALEFHSNRDGLEINSLANLLSNGIYIISEMFLRTIGNRYYVKDGFFSAWQDIITLCPPLLIVSSRIAYSTINNKNYDIYYLRNLIRSNLRNTALLHPYIEILQNKQLSDLHIHLNGSTEVDILWQYCLQFPNEMRKDFKKAYKDILVKEQIEQENYSINPDILFKLLKTARVLRYYLVQKIIGRKDVEFPSESLIDSYNSYIDRETHPLNEYIVGIDNNIEEYSHWEYESLMYIKIIHKIKEPNFSDELFVHSFHYYLLILGQINSLAVQQKHQTGFIQFQKITKNKLRDNIEKKYKNRFFQLNGNESGYLGILEGRFSCKSTPDEICKQVSTIKNDWNSFAYSYKARIYLTVHFIKEKDDGLGFYRYEKLRNKIWMQVEAICSFNKMKKDKDILCIDGIDAASSEFDTPPEVFAPGYRFLRRKGIKRFTFHVGEDFCHIISGLRAIYEAIIYFDFQTNDRIGHATALGIPVELWKERIGNYLYIKKGEWLDNLLFCHYMGILNANIDIEIETLSFDLYGKRYTVGELIGAWELRKWDPEVLLNSSSTDFYMRGNYEEIPFIINNNELEILKYYHSVEGRKKYNDIIMLSSNTVLLNEIELLQKKIICLLNSKAIIRETLPTSNVRIGLYNNYKEHHLRNWLTNLSSLNFIVVGSDDPGIFATNIFNEYAHIHESMELESAIPYLLENAKKYCLSKDMMIE